MKTETNKITVLRNIKTNNIITKTAGNSLTKVVTENMNKSR